MPSDTRTLPIRRVVSTRSGDDPDVIDDCHAVYGDDPKHLTFDLTDLEHGCPNHACGHVYVNRGGSLFCLHCDEEFAP